LIDEVSMMRPRASLDHVLGRRLGQEGAGHLRDELLGAFAVGRAAGDGGAVKGHAVAGGSADAAVSARGESRAALELESAAHWASTAESVA
jgi:hypothetical protein